MIDYNHLLPGIIREIVAGGELDYSKLPYSKSIEAGVLFTDVSGFTKMTELVSKGGHYSIEIITDLLNSYFEAMNKCIDEYDGDLIKYGGDSILAIFPGDEDSAEARMKICLVKMKQRLKILNIQFQDIYNLDIDFHGNFSWGEVKINIVGDEIHHLDYFITGKPLEEVFAQGDITIDVDLKSTDYKKQKSNLIADNQLLSNFLPKRVNDWLGNNKFSGELKNSAVMFVKIQNADDSQAEIGLQNYHKFYRQMQNIVYFYEGTINKIDYTDKGYLILITFGVPYLHNDDIERAFVCSTKISKMAVSGIKTKIGLTYQNIFSGILGAKKRYEYGIIGNGVNISARLMSESPYNDFTFSSEIIPSIKGRYETQFIKKVQVKGIAEEIEIYHITKELSDYWSAFVAKYENDKLFGYDDILITMEGHLLTCISGNPGSGKSHLVYEFLKAKIENKDSNLILVMSEYDKLKPFTIFYKLISRFLAIDSIVDDIILVKRFLKKQCIKLDLDIIIDYFHESSIELKEKNLPIVEEILTEILVTVLKENDILVIENTQWLDQQSSKLLIKMIPKLQVEKKKVLLTTNDINIFNDYIYYSPLKVEMKNFDEALTKEFFLSKNLNVTPKALKEILTLSQSNPAYIKEVCSIIEENWSSSKGIFDVSDFLQLVRAGKLPKSFETVLLNDFEAFDEDTKQLLKYASIMGVSFNDQLMDIFSEEFVREHIQTVLKKLTANKHIFKKLILPEVEYFFNNSLMRDAIYRTILFKEKQKLHITIANYYIKNYKSKISMYYEVIANHFILAKSDQNIVKWSLLAAQKNYVMSAYGICNYYYSQALDFCEKEKERNDILLLLVEVNIAQNKIREVAQYQNLIQLDMLSQEQIDLYYFYQIRLYEIQKDFQAFKSTYQKIKDIIQSQEILFRIKLILFDYYRMCNSLEQFETLKKELKESIDSQSITIGILFYSIIGQYYLDRADYKLAEENYQILHKIAQENDKRFYLRISETSLGIIQIRLGNQEKGLEYFKKALNIAEDIGDKHGYAKVSTEIAMIYFAQGLDDQALATLENCLSTAKYIGDKQQEQTVLYNFGYIYFVLQEYERAITYFTPAKEIAELIDDKVGIAYANDGLGDAFFHQGNLTEAKKIYETNLKRQQELQDKEGIAHSLGNLANVMRAEKDYEGAFKYYQIQEESLNEIGDKIGQGKALFNWGITFEILGDDEKAVEKLITAYKLFNDAKDINYASYTQEQIDRIKGK